jgi:alpha-1,3/alpha-1,6-mannosyltransferase
VDIYTAYYDPNRCFEETKGDLFGIIVAGNWFPRNIFGRLHVVCAIIRCCLACLAMAWRTWSGNTPDYDVVVVDQVAAVIPLLKLLLQGTRILFYCHFPDQLLTSRRGLLKAVYRAPIDWLEEEATGMADTVLVNSNYTRGVFQGTFRRLWARGMRPEVLYPCVAVPTDAQLAADSAAWPQELSSDQVAFIRKGPTFLSINRCAAATEPAAAQLRQSGAGCGGGQQYQHPQQQHPKRLHQHRGHVCGRVDCKHTAEGGHEDSMQPGLC